MSNQKRTFPRTKIASIASALLLASVDVNALGLGVLDVQSNLDQPLKGVIELRVNAGDDINSVRASIASRQDFESFGIDYPDYLNNVNVSLDRSSGQPRLVIDSDNIIVKEPFIHLLIRVDWAGGSFLREYTALIDPPVYASEAPKSFSQPVTVGSDQSYQSAPIVQSRPSSQANSFSRPVSNTQSNSTSSFQTQSGSGTTYGPVEAGDSLSLIATQLQYQFPDLSIYQIMQALFEENKSAFIGGNINGLIKGSVLNINDINSVRSIGLGQAKQFFSTQNSDWNNVRSVASNSGLKIGKDEYNDSNDAFANTNKAAPVESFQVGTSAETQRLISDSDNNTSDGEVVVLRQQISELESSLSSSDLENQELKERVSLLEGQLSDLNTLMKLKVADADLAGLENALAKSNAAKDELLNDLPTINNDSVSGLVSDVSSDISSATENLEIDGVNLAGGSESAEISIDQDVADSIESADIDIIETTEDALEVAPGVSVVEEIKVTKPKGIVIPPAEPTLLEKAKAILFEGGLWKILAGIGGVLVLAVGALFIRRRRADEEFEISMLSIESNSQSIDSIDSVSLSKSMSASVTASVNEGDAADDQETSFLTVYSDSDAVVQADEVDPIAEADVYIAYGRHEQAEEVLLDGITNYPQRNDIKQKLLSVYHKNNNSEGFERVAEELYSQRESLEPEAWDEICEMGRDIDPSNPLFELSSSDIAAASAVSVAGNASQIDGELDLLSDVESSKSEEPLAGAELSAGQESLAGEDQLSNEESPIDIDSNSQFDVDDDSVHLINFDEDRSEISELDEVADDALNFEIPLTEVASQEANSLGEKIELTEEIGGDIEDEMSIDFDNSVLEFDADDNELNNVVIDIDEAVDLSESDSGDIELDGDLEFSVDPTVAGVDADLDLVSENLIDDIDLDLDGDLSDADDEFADLEVSDLEIDDDYDELRTQYELAKVSADLGDDDGARKILNDIIADSNAEEGLVSESKQLLESIS